MMDLKLVALWIWFSYTTGRPRQLQTNNMETVEDSIGSMTRHIVETYFSQGLCVGVITNHGHLLRYILTATPTIVVAVSTVPQLADSEEFETFQEETKVFNNIMVKLLDQGCLSFVIQVNNPRRIVEYFYRSSRRSASRSNKRYLYLPPLGTYDTVTYDVKRFFAMKEMSIMPDLLIAKLVTKEQNVKENSTNKDTSPDADGTDQRDDTPYTCGSLSCPFGEIQKRDTNEESENLCHNWKEIQIVTHEFVGSNPGTEVWLDTWVSGKGFLEGTDLYPNKMKNLEGKMVQVAAVPNYPPYTIVHTNATPPVYDGIELRFVKDFARQLNFTFRVVTDDVGWWGEVWPNGTGNGMWGNVAMDIAIMGFGATYAWLENYAYIDYSQPYFRSSVRCLTPHPQKLPGWMTPLLPFSHAMWLAVGISMLVITTSLYLVTRSMMSYLGSVSHVYKCFSTLTASAISSVGLLLQQAPDEDRSPQYVPLRHLLAWLNVFFLLINSIYGSGLSSVLTVPRFEHPIDTVEDLARSDMLWAATTEAWVFSIQGATEPNLIHITHNFQVMTNEELLAHAYAGNMAFAVERLLGGNYALPPYVNEKTVTNLRAMRDDLYSGYCVFNVRKGSPFLETLNILVLRLHAAGLLLNYEGQVVRALSQHMQLVLAQNDQPTSGSGPVSLQAEHVQGPLFFLGIGLLTASLVFITEVLNLIECKVPLPQ